MTSAHDSINRMRDLAKVRALVLRLGYPWWMANPSSWHWARPDGMPQGFSPLRRDAPGLANLLWLSLDMGRPPREYDANANALYSVILNGYAWAKVGTEWMSDVASMCTLTEFIQKLEQHIAGGFTNTNHLETAYPLLIVLAKRRLHADP